MSMKRPWYKRYPDHFFGGTMGMRNELKGTYSMLIDLWHATDGKLRDDPVMIAHALGLQPRKWERLKAELVAMRKLQLNRNGTEVQLQLNSSSIEVSPSQPIEKVRSGRKNAFADKIERKKESISNSPSFSQSAGARAGDMEAPARPALPEKKQADKTPQLSEEERAAFVRKILGREVRPGRLERPELHPLLDED